MSGGRSARKKPAVFVHLRVASDYPEEEQDKLTLLRFLEKMGCDGLLAAPWGVFDHPQLATELIGEQDARFKGNLWANPRYWQRDLWQNTYEFAEGDVKLAERVDKWTAGEFLQSPDPRRATVSRI